MIRHGFAAIHNPATFDRAGVWPRPSLAALQDLPATMGSDAFRERLLELGALGDLIIFDETHELRPRQRDALKAARLAMHYGHVARFLDTVTSYRKDPSR